MHKNPLKRSPLHEQIAERLRQEIRTTRKPGQRLAPEPELAARFGVSLVTLRNATLILQGEGLLERRQGSGTYVKEGVGNLPACQPSTIKHSPFPPDRHVAIFSGFDVFRPRVSHYYIGAIEGLRSILTDAGIESCVYVGHGPIQEAIRADLNVIDPFDRRHIYEPTRDICPEFTQALSHDRIRAIVSLSGTLDHMACGSTITALGIPVVGAAPYHVTSNADQLAALGARALAAQGCRRIALIGYGAFLPPHASAPDKVVEGFNRELNQLGLDLLHPGWVRHGLDPRIPGAGWEEFREIWSAAPEKPDGLIVTDDLLFQDVIKALVELGLRVPDQLRIVAHANKGSGLAIPFPVALLEYDPAAHAAALAGMLLPLLEGREPERKNVIIPHRLIPMPPTRRMAGVEEDTANIAGQQGPALEGVLPTSGHSAK